MRGTERQAREWGTTPATRRRILAAALECFDQKGVAATTIDDIRAASNMTPLAYHSPLALWALLLIGPLTLVAANLLAAWPARRAARLRTGPIRRTE